MSITSLSALASGDISDIRSSQLLMVSSDTGYRVDLTEVYAKYALENVGAAWICNSAQTRSVFDTCTLSAICRSLAYDYGDFTDANSPGVFWIKNNKWAYVELGMDMLYDSSNHPMNCQPAKGAAAQTEHYIYLYGPGTGSLSHYSCSVRLAVSSGDKLDWWNTVGVGTYVSVATDTSRIWIRGYRTN